MPVTDEQEATLRAQLAKRFGEHERRLQALDPVEARTGYSALVSAAFAVAVDERFPLGTPKADVVGYVEDVRSRTEDAAKIDARIAERVIRAIIADEEIDDIDSRTTFETQLLLLAALVADANLDAAGLDAFMSKARKLADQWLA